MCFAHVKYSCNHKEKRRLKCRKLWSARTGWCCYPAFLLAFGWPNEEPCGDFVQGKAVFSSKICPECTEAEQSTPQTNGIVPSKYRHKLTPEALNASRRRMQEEKEKENAVKERWYSREENFQEMLRKREQEERLDRDAAAGTTAEAVKPLPGMPSLIHVPLGDRWGDPSYHYPPHVADAYDTAPITPPRDPVLLGSRGQQKQPPQQPERPVKNIDVVLRDWDQQSERRYQGRHCSNRHQQRGEYFESPVESFQHEQHLTAQDGYAEPSSLRDTRPAPKPPIAERRGHSKPQALAQECSRPGEPRRRGTEPTHPVRTPRSGPLKGFFQALGGGSRGNEGARCDRHEGRKVASDAHSDVSSFVCRDSRDVERGRRM